MSSNAFTAARRTAWWALLVVLATLLVAQQQGLEHRIAHAGWGGTTAPAQERAPGDEHAASQAPSATHDCAAYDAATLGQGPPSVAVVPTASTLASHAAPAPFVRPAASRCAAGFHARAPPRA